MPFLNVKVSVPKSQKLAESIISVLMKNTGEILGKKEDVTSICIEFIHPELWFINGIKTNEHNKVTFYLDVKVTKGTNTKGQKALYIEKTFFDMKNLLGDIMPASYIVVDEVEADSWGFEGQTQERRFISSTVL